MSVLNSIVRAVLIVFAFSCGRVFLQKGRKIMPGLADLFIVLALWVLALAGWFSFSTWIWLMIAALTGISVSLVVPGKSLEAETDLERSDSAGFIKRLWKIWKGFAFRLGNFQARIIMGFFYFTILIPFGLINKVLVDPLNLKKSERNTLWFEFEQKPEDIEAARRQF